MPEGFKQTRFTATIELLQVGQSFLCPWADAGEPGTGVSARANQWARNRNLSWKFRTRREENGVRVWRVE